MATAPASDGARPPAGDAVHISVQVAADAELSPALTAVLDQLVQLLAAEAGDEVQGYQYQPAAASGRPLRYDLQYRRGALRPALQGLQ